MLVNGQYWGSRGAVQGQCWGSIGGGNKQSDNDISVS